MPEFLATRLTYIPRKENAHEPKTQRGSGGYRFKQRSQKHGAASKHELKV